MNEQIAALLAEANLSEEQVQKIAGICQEAIEADRSTLRAAHLDEVASLTEANKEALAALTKTLAEARRLNTTVEMVVGESKLILDKRRGVAITVVAEGVAHTQLVGKAFVAEAKKMCMDSADGDADDADDKKEGEEEVDEAVKAGPRRVVAKRGEAQAVGIDLDQGGTLAFTVSSIDGSAAIELSKPDSDAVKAWFSSLQESDAMDDEEDKGDDLEESDDFLARFEKFAGGTVKAGRMTIGGFPVDLNDTDGTYMDVDAVDADAAAGFAKAAKKAGFKVKRAGKTGVLVERNAKALVLDESAIEERVASLLEAALEPYVPVLREMRSYVNVKGRLNAIQEALAASGVFDLPQPLAESTTPPVEDPVLTEKVGTLEAEVAALRTQLDESNKREVGRQKVDLFTEKTQDMALTTREKVKAIVEAAAPGTIDEYTSVLEAAVVSVKPPAASAKQDLLESAGKGKGDGPMAEYLRKL